MNNQAFDEALQRIVAEEKLPYSDNAWQKVSARLDAHAGKKKKVFPLTPALRWAAAAMLAALAVGAGWMLRGEREASGGSGIGTVVQQSSGTTKLEKHEIPTPMISEGSTETPAAATANNVQKLQRSRAPELRNIPSENNNIAPSNKLPQSAPELINPTIAKVEEAPPPILKEGLPKPRQAQPSRMPSIVFAADGEDAATPTVVRRTVFDINGGFGSGAQRATFALGVAVKKSLSDRLQFEGGLAVVSATNFDAPSSRSSNDAFVPNPNEPGIGTSNLQSVEPTPAEETRAAFAYLQASPTVSYRIYKGFSAGGGPDAQRLLTAAERGVSAFNAAGVESAAPQPEWDFGLAARADYNVSERLRLGVLYRESIRATNSRSTRKAAGRDYFLVRLSYALF